MSEKLSCHVVEDLLPLYLDGVVSGAPGRTLKSIWPGARPARRSWKSSMPRPRSWPETTGRMTPSAGR